jgi:hypothetical protein
MNEWSIFLVDEKWHVVRNSQCKSQQLFMGVREFLSWGHETTLDRGHKTLPNSTQSKRHIWKVFVMYEHIWPW